MLLAFPLETMMIRKLIGLKSQINKGDALYFDLVDITKKYYKSMEDIGATWDGSEGVVANGYEMVDVSLDFSSKTKEILKKFFKNHPTTSNTLFFSMSLTFEKW